jgi:hypothetical protein
MVTHVVQTEPRISPYARRLAARRRIPVVELAGTGPGEVVVKDVRRAGELRRRPQAAELTWAVGPRGSRQPPDSTQVTPPAAMARCRED